MPITLGGQGRFTGLLGYDRNYEYLGESNLPYRLVEKYTYTVYDYQLDNRTDLPAFFKTQFAGLLGVFSGNINIVSFDTPSSSDQLQSSVEFKKHVIAFEVRSSGIFSDTTRDGYENAKNLGLTAALPYTQYVKGFKDSFSLANADGGVRNYSHDISFSLVTGAGYMDFPAIKSLAQTIAQGIYSNEPDILSRSAFQTYGNFNDSDTKQYFSETFDALAYSFSFSKKKVIEAYDSGSYSHSLSHSVSLGEKGVFDIKESLKVVGKLTYTQALNGFVGLSSGSQSRCQTILNGYTGLIGSINSNWTGFGASLYRMSSSETRNIPGISVNGTFSYSNDPSKQNGFSRAEVFDITKSEDGGIITIVHGLNYGLDAFINTGTDTLPVSGSSNILQIINQDRNDSLNSVRSVYYSLNNITGLSSGIFRTKSSVNAPVRGKNYTASFNYTNDPSFDLTSYANPFSLAAITGFKNLSIEFQNTETKRRISEYKVINRPTQDSVLHYGYQEEPGTFSVTFKGKLPRRGNLFVTSSRYVPTQEAADLLAYSKQLFLNETLKNNDVFNYCIKDLKYNVDSSNSFDMSVQYLYTKKLYGNI